MDRRDGLRGPAHLVQRAAGVRVTYPFAAAARESSLDTLDEESFDLLVIGGGITGAGVARDAAMRGLRVALVEREDFASGTSSRSSRLVHGGLRYLEHGQLHLVYESSRERRILLRIAPHLVRPRRFLWPMFEKSRLPPWKLRAGFFLYDALALFRNIGNHRALSAPLVSKLEPALRRSGLRGGVNYFDAATDDIRLTLANARAAAEAGAVVANHLEVRELIMEGGGVRGARADDLLTRRCIEISAHTVVNATGPWGDSIRRLADPEAPPSVRGTKGVHLAVPRERVGNQGALTLLSPIDGRVVFVLPAANMTVIGTTDTDYGGEPEHALPSHDDVTYLLRTANSYFPSAHLVPADVVSSWAGIRPLVRNGTGAPDSISREHALTWSAPRLLSVSGGKLTTYRAMAEEVVDEVVKSLGQPVRHVPTDRMPLPGGEMTSFDDELEAARAAIDVDGLPEHLVSSYGTEWRYVWEIVENDNALAARVSPGLPYIAAEIRWAVEHEMALTLPDILIRRLHVAFETHDHGASSAPAVARVAAPLLGWNTARIDSELAKYGKEVAEMFGR